jgi:RimJ/RimL family protein N-acetyltransferase
MRKWRFMRKWQDGTRLSLVIRRRFDDQAVGTVELRPNGEEADVSYVVDATMRGHGLASLALERLLEWAGRERGLRQANIACHVDNIASRRVAEKCGFLFVGRTGDELLFSREVIPPEPG